MLVAIAAAVAIAVAGVSSQCTNPLFPGTTVPCTSPATTLTSTHNTKHHTKHHTKKHHSKHHTQHCTDPLLPGDTTLSCINPPTTLTTLQRTKHHTGHTTEHHKHTTTKPTSKHHKHTTTKPTSKHHKHTTTKPHTKPTGEPFCLNFEDPHVGSTGTDYCMCGHKSTAFYSPVTTGGNPCPYTTWPPASLSVAPFAPTPTPIPKACEVGTEANFYTADCWHDLDLTDYVNKWWTANKGKCAHTSTDGSSTSFANCWYQLSTPYAPANCDVINLSPPCTNPSWDHFKNRKNGVKDFWVTWSIYNANAYFSNLYSAIFDAGGVVGGVSGQIITTLNPPDPTEGQTPAWEYALDALTFGLSLYSEGSILTKALLRSLPQTSTLVTKVYPVGDVSGDVKQWGDVQGAVEDFVKTWADSVGGVLPTIQNDPAQFVKTASEAQLTQGVEDLSKLVDSLYSALGTYLVSGAIDATGYVVTRTANVDVAALINSGTKVWETHCTHYTAEGWCGGIYYFDGVDTYSLVNKALFQQDETKLLDSLFGGSDPLAIAGLVFSGSLKCSRSTGKNGGSKPTIDPTDITSVSCLGNARVCTWNWDAPTPFVGDCTADDMPDVGGGTCDPDAPPPNSSGCVPRAYLTGAILGPYKEPSAFYETSYCNVGCAFAGGT